jgi:MFS transporter, DHA1 family, multidrug/chloramphenicol efflux transport protein
MLKPLIDVSPRKVLFFAVFLLLYEFTTYIANDLIMPVMINIIDVFHAPEYVIAMSMSVYMLGGSYLQLILGPLSDRFGRRPVMLVGVLWFCVITFLLSTVNNIDDFLFLRFLEGAGLCFIQVIGYALLQEIFEDMDALRLFSIMGSISIMAPLIGPFSGAALSNFLDWRQMFVMLGIFSLVAFLGLLRYMPETVGKTKINGQVIPKTKLSLGLVFTNYYTLFKNPAFVLGAIAVGLMAVPLVLWIASSPSMIVMHSGSSLMAYGLWQIPVLGSFVFGNLVLAKMTHKFELKQLQCIGTFIVVLGLLLVDILMRYGKGNFVYMIPGLMIYCLGFSLSCASLNRYVLFVTKVPKGTASAGLNIISMWIQVLGIYIGDYIYADHVNIKLGTYFACFAVLISFILAMLYRNFNYDYSRS